MHRLPEDSPAKNKPIKKMIEKLPRKKGGQKLTWHQVITRDLTIIDIIDLQKAIKL